MNLRNMKNLVAKNVRTFGQEVKWTEFPLVEGERDNMVPDTSNPVNKSARVIIVKEKYSPISSFSSQIGLNFDATKYLICLPEVELKKNMIITDSLGQKWKTDVVETWDIAAAPVAKISSLTEVA